MRLAIITVVFVALLSVQVACSSPKYTWYTVEPDALDSLAVSPEDVSEGKRPPAERSSSTARSAKESARSPTSAGNPPVIA